MYCADPDYEYCADLRKAEEQVRNNARCGVTAVDEFVDSALRVYLFLLAIVNRLKPKQ
jgi:hypothetical protein